MEQDRGRNLIIIAAALILVAASVRIYADRKAESGEDIALLSTIAASQGSCDDKAIMGRSYRLGCQRDTRIGGSHFTSVNR